MYTFTVRSETRQGCPPYHFFQLWAQSNEARNRNHTECKGKTICTEMINDVCAENLKSIKLLFYFEHVF